MKLFFFLSLNLVTQISIKLYKFFRKRCLFLSYVTFYLRKKIFQRIKPTHSIKFWFRPQISFIHFIHIFAWWYPK